jgi:hypothetical protein
VDLRIRPYHLALSILLHVGALGLFWWKPSMLPPAVEHQQGAQLPMGELLPLKTLQTRLCRPLLGTRSLQPRLRRQTPAPSSGRSCRKLVLNSKLSPRWPWGTPP